MFLPTTKEEMDKLGWEKADVIIVSGDAYIDSPYDGAALVGKSLMKAGFKTAIISQPNIAKSNDIKRLGEPKLFWGVTAGCVDSMVANYTALKKRRNSDDLTPGGKNNRRPDRATIKYTNLIRQYFKKTVPIVLGGIEASLRRIAHYDFWQDKVRRSVLVDSKADYIVYGMAEKTIVDLANAIKYQQDTELINGICYVSSNMPEKFIEIPSFQEVSSSKGKFIEAFNIFYKNSNDHNTLPLCQKHSDKYIVQNPPYFMNSNELDDVHEMDFEYKVHPYYAKQGKVKAYETTTYSINTHRGCYGECNFCAIAVHQGRRIISRSIDSIKKEVGNISKLSKYKGTIRDMGGPTANMYGNNCKLWETKSPCKNKRCFFPDKCKQLDICHGNSLNLIKEVEQLPEVKKVNITSGLRYDLILADKKQGKEYLFHVVSNNVNGQLKIAPEHTNDKVLELMGKPKSYKLKDFIKQFYKINQKFNKKQYLTYYFIAAHPGCDVSEMKELKSFISKEIKAIPEQIQIFTPTPLTISSVMHYTGINPLTGQQVYVDKSVKSKSLQKNIILNKKKN